MIPFSASVENIDELNTVLTTMGEASWVTKALKSAIPELQQLQKEHYTEVSQNTPYSLSYIGQLKPSGRVRAGFGGDPGYAKDTLALYSDLAQFAADQMSIQQYSDLGYAAAQEGLAQLKGTSLILDDDVFAGVVEMALGDGVDELWQP